VYHQYCLSGPSRGQLVRAAIRRGVDLGTVHADVCTRLDLFAAERTPAPGADRAREAVQVPVYASLTDAQLRRVAKTVRRALSGPSPTPSAPVPSTPSTAGQL